MRTYEEAFAAAADKPAFSNGTEGHAWMGNWCHECVHDKSARDDTPPDPRNDGILGCPLVAVALMGRTPVEWIEQPWGQVKGAPEGQLAPALGDTYHCTEFRDEDEDGDDDNPPPGPPEPENPAQLTIFDELLDQALPDLLPERTAVPA